MGATSKRSMLGPLRAHRTFGVAGRTGPNWVMRALGIEVNDDAVRRDRPIRYISHPFTRRQAWYWGEPGHAEPMVEGGAPGQIPSFSPHLDLHTLA